MVAGRVARKGAAPGTRVTDLHTASCNGSRFKLVVLAFDADLGSQ